MERGGAAGECSTRPVTGDGRVRDFQRNTSFVAFIFVVCFAAFVFVTQSLREVVVPLIWSAFFAVPLTALISDINQVIIKAFACVISPLRCRGQEGRDEAVSFHATVGENVLYLDNNQAALTMLDRVNNPWHAYCGKLSVQVCSCCRRRIRIATLEGECRQVPEVNRFVRSWAYYAKRKKGLVPDDKEDSDHLCGARQRGGNNSSGTDDEVEAPGKLQVHLFVDQAERYPAVVDLDLDDECTEAGLEAAAELGQRPQLTGTLEIDGTTSLSWFVSVVLALVLVVGGVAVFITFLSLGATNLENNVAMYEKGANEFVSWFGCFVKQTVSEEMWTTMDTKAKAWIEEAIPEKSAVVLVYAQGMGWQALLFLIYLCFWIFEPLPINSSVAHVFKAYILLKTLVCVLFAGLMSTLLLILGCKLWHLFFLITFILNYIPEVGPMLAAALMIPAVLLDGNMPIKVRQENTLWLFIFGMAFKIITANIIEVQMYTTRGGEFMRMHPVILMALMMFCEEIMGITGMFLAVPIMAAVKYYLVSVDMPGVYLNPVLTLLEGDVFAPHKNFVDRNIAAMKARKEGSLTETTRGASRTMSEISDAAE